jgi:predicted aspartyl protease
MAVALILGRHPAKHVRVVGSFFGMSMNKTVTISAAKLIAVTCLLLFARPSPCRPRGRAQRRPVPIAELPFRLSHDLLVVLQGRIGSITHLRFVLDTGSTGTVVDRRVGDRLQLSCQRERAMMRFNRSLHLRRCTLPELGMGPLRLKNLPVSVASLPELSSLLDEADVIVGLDVLGASKFVVDYSSAKVVFHHFERPMPITSKDPDDPLSFSIGIQVQGHPIHLIVDTGIEGLFLYEDRLRKRVPHLKVLGAPEKVNIGGSLPAVRVTLPGVRLGKTEKSRPVLLIADPPRNVIAGIGGFIGISELNARRVTFDFIARTLTLEH